MVDLHPSSKQAFSLWSYRASVVRVIDGDTVVLCVDLGFGCRYVATIRISGINSPELPGESGLFARDALIELLYSGYGEWPLRVITEKRSNGNDAMSFSRYVGKVGVVHPDGTVIDVAQHMIDRGYSDRYSR